MSLPILNRIGLIFSFGKDEVYSFVRNLIGKKPGNISLYKMAFTHRSTTSNRNVHLSNERLEYLGDAILDAIISDILYKRFPYKNEGELTHYRSNVVKRTSLNKIAINLGISEMIIAARNTNISSRLYGDMLEAFIGALYIDKGYRFTFHFVQDKIIDNLLSTEDLVIEHNYKSKFLEWGQCNKKRIVFTEKKDVKDERFFISKVQVDDRVIAEGRGKTKKESHNDAAHKGMEIMKILS